MSRATTSGVPPSRAIAIDGGVDLGRHLAAALLDEVLDGVGRRPCGSTVPFMFTPLMRVCAENGHELGLDRPSSSCSRTPNCLARTTIERPSGVSSASDESCAASARSCAADARGGDELDGLAVAERDRARLVEQQHVDVARGLDRAARQGEHVAAHQAVHAGDADAREQRADRRRDQRRRAGRSAPSSRRRCSA